MQLKNKYFGKSLPSQYISNNFKDLIIHPVKRRIAKYYLVILKKIFGLKVIAITGSAGKTTTKEMIASILSREGKTKYSYANIDPVYNIPTTILKTPPWTKYLVLEMGIEYKNEMDFYLWLVKPDMGVITNISTTHTEFFKNEKGVFNEKSKLVKNLKKSDIAVLNYKNKYLKRLRNLKANVVWFNKDIKASNIKLSLEGTTFSLKTKRSKHDIEIPIVGKQFVDNALAAIATAQSLSVGIENIKRGLTNFERPKHRMRVINHQSGAVVIDDAYNNNPMAAKLAIETLGELPGKQKILVFGDMLELGNNEVDFHKEIAKHIFDNNINKVICVGKLSHYLYDELKSKYKISAKWAINKRAALPIVRKHLKKDRLILIKGSRSIELDYIVEKL